MKNATKYLVVGSLGVLMTRRDISSLAVKGLMSHRQQGQLEMAPPFTVPCEGCEEIKPRAVA